MKYFTKDNLIILLVIAIAVMTMLYTCKGRKTVDTAPIIQTVETVRDVIKSDIIRERRITDSMNKIIRVKDVVISNTKEELSATKYLVGDMLKEIKTKKPCDDTAGWAKRISDLQRENTHKDILCDSVITLLEQDTSHLRYIISEKDRSLDTTRSIFNNCSQLNEQLATQLNAELKKNKRKTGWIGFFKGTTVAALLFAIFKSL